MKRLPVDVSNFELMIKGNYLYIDKTKNIYELITKRRLYFLSRPRRFGKSLLISTFKEIFSGNKSLFSELWIGKESSYNWQEHPVIQLDFSNLSFETSEEFKISLSRRLDKIAQNYGIDLSLDQLPGGKIETLVESLAQRNKVVILIDEYDAPLLNNLDNLDIARAIQKVMKHFFSVIKSLDAFGHIHAIFITGVTKFAKTSIFSGFNNLNDMTLSPETSMLLGYSFDELQNNFGDYAQEFSKKNKITISDLFEILKNKYDGYRFSSDPIYVYNPYSVINCFDKNKIANYWLETGTPKFLIELLKKNYAALTDIQTKQMSSKFLSTFEIGELPLIPILYQAGYVTIADYNVENETYSLKFPNEEVSLSFNEYLIASLTETNERPFDRPHGRTQDENEEYSC